MTKSSPLLILFYLRDFELKVLLVCLSSANTRSININLLLGSGGNLPFPPLVSRRNASPVFTLQRVTRRLCQSQAVLQLSNVVLLCVTAIVAKQKHHVGPLQLVVGQYARLFPLKENDPIPFRLASN